MSNPRHRTSTRRSSEVTWRIGFRLKCITVVLGVIQSMAVVGGWSQEPSMAILADGNRFNASLVEVSGNWAALLKGPDGPRRVNASKLVLWGEFGEEVPGPVIVLAGGSVLRGEIQNISENDITVLSRIFFTTVLQRQSVRCVVLRPHANLARRDQQVIGLANEPRAKDRMWTANGDELDGEIVAPEMLAVMDGAAIIQLGVIQRAGTPPLVTGIENITAVGFASDAKKILPPKTAYGLIGLRDGTRLWTNRVTQDGTDVRLELNDGTILSTDAAVFWNEVNALQIFGDHVTYVSDVEMPSYKHIPYLSISWDHGADRNVLGGLLRCEGRAYAKGIAMHSSSRLAIPLGKSYRRFEVEAAIDQAAERLGSVIFRVYTERDTSSWQLAYESPIVRGGDRPVPISVDVSGVTRLALVVDLADRGDEGDHANWLNARLIP